MTPITHKIEETGIESQQRVIKDAAVCFRKID